MRDSTKKIIALGALILLMGCTNQTQQTGTGVVIKNELSSEQMQPGGTVLLRTSVNNFFDNELTDLNDITITGAKLTRSFGQLNVDSQSKRLGTVQANPNATARVSWSLQVKESASSGTTFTNKVRLCFNYNQTAWHELGLVNSFDVETQVNNGEETGPLKVSFAGLEQAYIQNEDVQSQVPISVSIKNNYKGYVGTIDMSRDTIPNITYIEMRIYDDNASPLGNHLTILSGFTNPSCASGQTRGCFKCDNTLWDGSKGYYKCYANDLPMFGEETFIGAKLNVTHLESEELIQLIEVLASYNYCIESDEFTITVFTPGGR